MLTWACTVSSTSPCSPSPAIQHNNSPKTPPKAQSLSPSRTVPTRRQPTKTKSSPPERVSPTPHHHPELKPHKSKHHETHQIISLPASSVSSIAEKSPCWKHSLSLSHPYHHRSPAGQARSFLLLRLLGILRMRYYHPLDEGKELRGIMIMPLRANSLLSTCILRRYHFVVSLSSSDFSMAF